ncbi:alpha/beta fold hydrolase [Phenylobacterium aquaticum]|uniref:alpha/beta fold hydrolase n=1 Tax=Phenylobacterium aquaticum TaxID=1763816 RepID=UPI0026EB6795|nr:alpha/beta hydrolase [Phenylobacterium aquaticum]
MSRREAVGVPAGSMMIVVDGVSLAVAREGRGPAVVCLHAIGHGGGDFASLAQRIGDRFEVIRIDWPGHGRSGEDRTGPSPARYAQLLAGLLDQLSLARPILVGCSIGGAAAITFARDHAVAGLVLCDPGGLVEVDATVARFCGLFAAFFRAGERGAWWYGAAYGAYYRWLVLPARAARVQRRRIIAAGREMAGQLRRAWEGFGRPGADLRAVAAALDAPVWFAWARDDRVIPLSRCRPAIKAMKHAQVTVFPGGHAAFLEQPDAFAAGFRAFAARL